MAKLTAQEYATKQIERTSAASPAYIQGIQRTESDPMALAAAAAPKWINRLNEPGTKDKFIRGLGRTSKSDWQRAAVEKGASRLATGVQAARPKIEAFAAAFLPFQDSITQKVKSMPSDTFEQRVARATAQMTATHAFKR